MPVIEEKNKQLIEQDKQLLEQAAIIQKYKEKYGELWHEVEVATVRFWCAWDTQAYDEKIKRLWRKGRLRSNQIHIRIIGRVGLKKEKYQSSN